MLKRIRTFSILSTGFRQSHKIFPKGVPKKKTFVFTRAWTKIQMTLHLKAKSTCWKISIILTSEVWSQLLRMDSPYNVATVLLRCLYEFYIPKCACVCEVSYSSQHDRSYSIRNLFINCLKKKIIKIKNEQTIVFCYIVFSVSTP